MKKVLLLLMLFSLLSVPNTCFAGTPFNDIAGHGAASDIEAVYNRGIMMGTANNQFSPGQYVTRAQLAVCLVKTFGLNYNHLQFIKEPVPSDLYDDVEAKQWYSEASMITGYNKVISFTGRKFNPGARVTRMDVASAITDSFQAKKLLVATTLMAPAYTDLGNLTNKQQSDIGFVFNTGIMRYTGSQFKPDNNITRAELAVILNQTLKTIEVATPYEGETKTN